MNEPRWKPYVTGLCSQAWHLDPGVTQDVVAKIEALIVARVLTEPAVAIILNRAGVSEAEAEMIAPRIRVAIVT